MKNNQVVSGFVADPILAKNLPTYVIVTPARNEADFIELTIKSMISQTVLPLMWMIISDGSTDGTDEIIEKYLITHDWIKLSRMEERTERNFAGKAYSFNAGYELTKSLDFEIIGNVDADISFEQDHFELLLTKFKENPRLGVAGTAFIEDSKVAYDYEIVNIDHVSGQCQLFRRKCFDQMGGYVPIKGGGVDWVAVTTARMKGWETRTFTERAFVHHRIMGTGMSGILKSRFRFGKQDYYLGGHPLWELFRAVYQMKKKPYFLGGLYILAGYIWAKISGVEKAVSKELEGFRRQEQMSRLNNFFKKFVFISR
ncbi:glycosyltransferase [Methylomicrobium sp. Wu6]|uniref:glycosyltransferase n=1 Tax=Methylomicrobium sp. Wu6 TaxID=3107928 RepID=UPI002DD69F20|nr:glycosyltransferase [Methylomicrobium sp. Wu6]MEC4749586.1 glycosyltransferase [Methylomicrobium sp. Wu6]